MWRERSDEGGSQGDPLELNVAARKKLIYLSFFHPSNICVPGVIDMKVIPKDKAISLHHAEHFGGDTLSHARIQH